MDISDFPAVNCSTTPLKADESSCISSRSADSDKVNLNQWRTPVRCNDSSTKRSKSKSTSINGNGFTKMPVYSPQSDETTYVKNPFEHGRLLKQRLSQPICSPSLFEKKVTPVKDDKFNWSIEDISVLRPAPINENPLQDFDTWFSPATENEAQKAINEFFSSQIVQMDSPVDRQCRVTKDIELTTRESWCQTMLTFPPVLPPEMEQFLSAYHTYGASQDIDDEDDDLSYTNSSVIKKKLFSPLKECEKSLCKTPIQINKMHLKQTVASTPLTSVLTSPELSPIGFDEVQDSPMDISMSFKSRTRLSLRDNVDGERENVQQMSWSHQSVVEYRSRSSPDSAISSV